MKEYPESLTCMPGRPWPVNDLYAKTGEQVSGPILPQDLLDGFYSQPYARCFKIRTMLPGSIATGTPDACL